SSHATELHRLRPGADDVDAAGSDGLGAGRSRGVVDSWGGRADGLERVLWAVSGERPRAGRLRTVDDGGTAVVLVRAREPVLAGDRAGVPGRRHLQGDHGDAGAGSLNDRGVPPPARAGT